MKWIGRPVAEISPLEICYAFQSQEVGCLRKESEVLLEPRKCFTVIHVKNVMQNQLSLVHIGDKIDFDFVDRAVDAQSTASQTK